MKPDIILLDINMPVMDGIRAAHEIRLISLETKIILLKVHDVPAFRNATERFSDAFLSKHKADTELIPVLNRLGSLPVNRSLPQRATIGPEKVPGGPTGFHP